jgi:hypothetical protein
MSGFDWPEPGAASEHWRSVTVEGFQQQLEAKSGAHAANEAIRKSYETNSRRVMEDMAKELRKVSQDKPDAIYNIVDQARQLALEFGVQRCRLQLFAPQLNETVSRNPKIYDDVNNNNDFALAKGVVKLNVAPGLRRTGDGRGYTFHEAVVIWPAAVYLGES